MCVRVSGTYGALTPPAEEIRREPTSLHQRGSIADSDGSDRGVVPGHAARSLPGRCGVDNDRRLLRDLVPKRGAAMINENTMNNTNDKPTADLPPAPNGHGASNGTNGETHQAGTVIAGTKK